MRLETTPQPFFLSLLLQPNHYQSTVKRLDDGYRVCDQIVACFQERAKIERNYALMMDEWSRKWQPLVVASEWFHHFSADVPNSGLLHMHVSFERNGDRGVKKLIEMYVLTVS